MSRKHGIVLIGAGNVGSHLARRMAECDNAPLQVFSRNAERARALGEAIGVRYTNVWEDIRGDAALYLLAVRDDAIAEAGAALARVVRKDVLAVHTSGSTPSTVLAPCFKHYGVFYPLQTFSAERVPDFEQIPVCVFAPHAPDQALLHDLAARISSSVHIVDDVRRAVLHVAAVFVNNFTNHMYHIGRRMLDTEGIEFALLSPLILETAQKVQAGADPGVIQTGPARRGDMETVLRHLEFLRKYPGYQDLYRLITLSINPALAPL